MVKMELGISLTEWAAMAVMEGLREEAEAEAVV